MLAGMKAKLRNAPRGKRSHRHTSRVLWRIACTPIPTSAITPARMQPKITATGKVIDNSTIAQPRPSPS
jgi:hypothetical protein